jgi:hypothetical protein
MYSFRFRIYHNYSQTEEYQIQMLNEIWFIGMIWSFGLELGSAGNERARILVKKSKVQIAAHLYRPEP